MVIFVCFFFFGSLLKASHVLLSGDHLERSELIEEEGNNGDDSLCVRYLTQVDEILTTDCLKGNYLFFPFMF